MPCSMYLALQSFQELIVSPLDLDGQYIPDSLHANVHHDDGLNWPEPFAALSVCGVFFKYFDGYECTVGIDYMSLWFKGNVLACIDENGDFVDPGQLALVRV